MVIHRVELEGESLSFISGIWYLDLVWMRRVIVAASRRDYYVQFVLLLWSDAGNDADSHDLE